VVGESIVETYVACDRPGVAEEAACLSLRPLNRASFDGGAAGLARQAAALGARVTLVTALPRTVEAEAFRERLESEGVRVRAVAAEPPMLEKQRFLVGHEKVFKLDLVAPVTLDATRRAELRAMCAEASEGGLDAAIVADFGHGMLTRRTCEDLSLALRPAARVLSGHAAGRRAALASLRGADLLAPTEGELRDAVNDHDSSLSAVAWKLMDVTGARAVATALAEGGMVVFRRTVESESDRWSSRVFGEHVPALETHAVDRLGCAETTAAVASLALAAGTDAVGAAYLGAAGASVQSRRVGQEPVTSGALLERLRQIDGGRLAVQLRSMAAPARAAT